MESEGSEDDDADSILLQLFIVAVLTGINAFFASSELAMLACNKNKLQQLADEGNKSAKAVLRLASDQTRFLSTIQVCITLAGFFSSATAATSIGKLLAVPLANLGMAESTAATLATVIVTLILSYISLVLGELFPKRVALQKPEQTAMKEARVILFVQTLFTPFVKLLSVSTNGLVKLFGMDNKKDDKISEEDIISVIETGVNDGTLNEGEQQMIESVFRFKDMDATDIMTPRVKVFMVDIAEDADTSVKAMIAEQYSRVPVYEDGIDNIIGIINLKDVFSFVYSNGKKLDLRSLLRKPYFVSDKIKIDELFALMQKSHNQIAVLTDEFGGFSGIVTMEDLTEEIMGNIYDEYDNGQELIVKNPDGTYTVDGITPIQDINRELGTDISEDDEDFDTLNGLITKLLGRLPEKNDCSVFEYGNMILKVLSSQKNRVLKVNVTVLPDEKPEEDNTDKDGKED